MYLFWVRGNLANGKIGELNFNVYNVASGFLVGLAPPFVVASLVEDVYELFSLLLAFLVVDTLVILLTDSSDVCWVSTLSFYFTSLFSLIVPEIFSLLGLPLFLILVSVSYFWDLSLFPSSVENILKGLNTYGEGRAGAKEGFWKETRLPMIRPKHYTCLLTKWRLLTLYIKAYCGLLLNYIY